MIIIIMGVSGSGKTTIGRGLAKKLDVPFYDADDYHTKENIEKMAGNIPLNDEDRKPWLNLLANKIKEWHTQSGAILACSALKESYRSLLKSQVKEVRWVYLKGSKTVIGNRISKREAHYMKSQMLDSQFEALEAPNYGFHEDIEEKPETIIDSLATKLLKHG